MPKLPPLREEVHCLDGPTQFDGSPSWTLHDPANNRFFRIGWAEFEMLTRWSLGMPQVIAERICAETTLTVDAEAVDHFARFLLAQNLLSLSDEPATRRLWQQVQDRRRNLGSRLLHNYLFFKIPLFKPDALLNWLYPRLKWIYSGWFLGFMLLCALTGLFLVSRQWEQFLSTFPHFFNWQGLSLYFFALFLAKSLHEMGHALTAHRYGCRVPSMGVAFMVMYPMLYTDANETWKLNERRQRLAIASAGIIAELGLAVFATLAWSFMADGPARSGIFLLATSTWIITLAINLSPFMRFDGYYLLSDWMKIENLQPRAFAYTLWRLRRLLFGVDAPPPEQIPARMGRFMVIYACCTWLYRFFLFLGIAWMVYHFFFKLLGIFLMCVEIGWFIIRPIWREIKAWPSLAQGRQAWRLAMILLPIAGLLWVPWQRHLELPALIKPEHYAELYLPYPARLQHLAIQPGQAVAAGDLLAELTSNELLYQSQSAGQEADLLAWQVAFQGVDETLAKQRQIKLRQWESAASKQAGIHRQLDQLRIQAPLAGRVLEINDQLQVGQWLRAGEALMIIADTSSFVVEAFVSEDDILQLVDHSEAWFYPENPDLPPLACRLTGIDDGGSPYLPALMASHYDGPIAARLDNEKKSIPQIAQYRLQLKVEQDVERRSVFPTVLRGTVKIRTQSSSIAERVTRQWLSIALRESGF